MDVLFVLRKVLSYTERLLHQVPEILGDLGIKALLAEDLGYALAGGELDVRDAVPVPQRKTYLTARHAVFAEIDDDLLDLRYVRVGPLGSLLPVGPDGTAGSTAPGVHSCHSYTSDIHYVKSRKKSVD